MADKAKAKQTTATTTETVIQSPPETPAAPAPLNPAIDPDKTAEERLAALDEQHKEMQKLHG